MKEIPTDEIGPEYVIQVYDPAIGMKGFLVIDNTVLGPGKGGIRMTQNVTEEEVYRLARTMTWKTSLANIPFGGAKAGIVWGGGTEEKKKSYIQSFARMVSSLMPEKYITAPDINTGEKEMQWFVEATEKWETATGKPSNYCVKFMGFDTQKCGIPHESGSTGFGVAESAVIAAEMKGIDIKGSSIAIHGFGNVGKSAYESLFRMGAKVVALADSVGTIYDKNGLDNEILDKIVEEGKCMKDYPNAVIPPEDFWKIPVDILIPASITDVINEKNKDDIKAKIIVEGANIPMKEDVEEYLFEKGIMIVPDFVANSGGVISSYAEYKGLGHEKAFDFLKEKIRKTTKLVLDGSMKNSENPRKTGLRIAKERIDVGIKNKKPER